MPASSSPAATPSTSPTATRGTTETRAPRLWSRTTTALLLLVGVVMGAIGFATVMSMGDMLWHSGRDAELVATYDAYQETGTLLIKETGSGSYGVQAPADGPLTFATWDDDPGSYLIASLMSHVTGSSSPYPGLTIAQGLLVAIPLVWLPLAVARIVGRARAGFAMILLPLVTWLFNHGATLVGTEYGLSDQVSTLPVYSLYGTAASLAFLSLSLIVLLSAYRLNLVGLIGATLGIAVLAAFGNMSRSLSGMGIAAAVGILWWIFARGRWRWVSAIGGALVTILLATVIQTGIMTAINAQRAETTGQAMTEVPDAHTAWHSLYLGLSYPTPLNGQASHFPVTWSDEFGWEKAREVDPDVLVASEKYDAILKDLYLEQVLADPVGAVKLYLQKSLFLAKHFGGLLLFIVIGFVVGMSVRSRPRPLLGRVLAIAAPLLLLGLVPAILVMPMLYYYSELSAALGLLAAVSLGVIVWALTSWPARARAREARRLQAPEASDAEAGVSVVLDADALDRDAVTVVAAELSEGDEVILVSATADAPGSGADATTTGADVRHLTRPGSGAGERLRSGILQTTGRRVIVLGAPWSGSAADLIEAARLSEGETSPAVPADEPRDVMRDALLGSAETAPRRFALDGADARGLAHVSKETGPLWFDEMRFGAAEKGANVVALGNGSSAEPRPSFRTRAAGFGRIALRREEYAAAPSR
ncbi:hypothetical protein [Microbacterium sp. 179-I 3D4 NHS]|uniref:hypothetical protein n=1 Tax=Microbacterium sp. 179-I 3D4 NHS TaxID=3142381 RepID=UPI00399F058D